MLLPRTSRAMGDTLAPCIVQMQKFLREISPPPLSLAQGIVHWTPPPAAVDAAAAALRRPAWESKVHAYGPAGGSAALQAALRSKLIAQNGLTLEGTDVMVTQGANQAFMNVVLTLLDGHRGEQAVLFRPFYFNHHMAITMTAGHDSLLLGPSDPQTLLPDLAWLEETLAARNNADPAGDGNDGGDDGGGGRVAMVVLTNPGNPTGVTLPPATLRRAAELTARHGAWLVVDNTYEHFCGGWYATLNGGPGHVTLEKHPPRPGVQGELGGEQAEAGEAASGVGGGGGAVEGYGNVVNIFSFSKAFGMMGWRVGYIVAPEELTPELQKAQDTIAICPTAISQEMAAAALATGRPWVDQQVASLQGNYEAVRAALDRAVGAENVMGGTGALYLMVRLPPRAGSSVGEPVDDEAVVEWLAREHGVCVIPGAACGTPGSIRVCFANLPPEQCAEAAQRLEKGLKELMESPPSHLR